MSKDAMRGTWGYWRFKDTREDGLAVKKHFWAGRLVIDCLLGLHVFAVSSKDFVIYHHRTRILLKFIPISTSNSG